jgi:RND family efflux transporter MFP subunit
MTSAEQNRLEDHDSAKSMDPLKPPGPGGESTKRTSRHRGPLIIVLIGLILICLFLIGYLPRRDRDKRLQTASIDAENYLPTVMVTMVNRALARSELTFPGSVESLTEAPLLARADGYLRQRLADIGDHVCAGQVLASIEAPELDQQVVQARAGLEQANAAYALAEANLAQQKANEQLAEVTAQRWSTLAKRGVVSRQEDDQKQAARQAEIARTKAAEASLKAAEENGRAARANLDRLQQLQAYKTVRAPFAGIVTARNVDVGTLITNGSSVLFRVAQIDVLRIFINVPQMDQPAIHKGLEAEIAVQQLPGQRFMGTVSRTANSLDPASRTLLTEVQIPNPAGVLLPGMYARVTLINLRSRPPLLIRGDCVVSGAKGTQIALLQLNDVVHFQNIVISRDFGTEVEVISGVEEGARVIVNPTDEVREGARVKPVLFQEKNGAGNSGGARPSLENVK